MIDPAGACVETELPRLCPIAGRRFVFRHSQCRFFVFLPEIQGMNEGSKPDHV